MDDILTPRELENKRKGQIAGGVMLIFLIIMLLLPLFWYQNPPPGQEGIQVNLGIPDIGMGDDLTAPPAPAVEEQEPEPVVEEEPLPVVESEPEPVPEREVVVTDDAEAIALRKKQEKDAADRKKAEDQKRREDEARKKAEAEAAEVERKRKAREAAAESTKNELSGLFGSGNGGGDTNKPGDGGATNGNPNSSNIGKKSFGSGTVGGGLGSRGVANSPRLVENSQKSGVVVVSLCVTASGKVDQGSVRFKQGGSTTTNSQLVNAAIRNAKSWGFTKGSVDRQCGTITYNFKVK